MYIGRGIDSIDNISTLDNLSFNGSDATFNLTQNSVAFVPVSADALQIQIDGVIQSGNYTVSGSTVTFDFTPSGSSVCNGIRHFGVGLLTQPSDGSVTTAKLGADSVTNTKVASSVITGQTAITSLADTDKFLVSDASDSGNLKYVEKQYLPSGGLVPITQSSGTSGTANVIVNGWITDTYEDYFMTYNMTVANSGASMEMTLYDTNGNLSSGGNYDHAFGGIIANTGGFTNVNGTGNNNWSFTAGMNNGEERVSVRGQMLWCQPRKSSQRRTILNTYRIRDTSLVVRAYHGAMEYNGTEALTGFYMNASSGDISKWQIRCYGIVNS